MRKRLSYGLANALLGTVEAELRSPAPEAFLNECVRQGVTLLRAERRDEVTLEVVCPLWQRTLLSRAAERSRSELRETARQGISVWWERRKGRRALMAGLAGVMGLLFLSSLFIWEIEVTENPTALSEGEILAAVEDAGVGIGSFWPGLSADMIRARALTALPELGFLTVNIHGSRAEVLARGREEPPELKNGSEPADVFAGKSGVITELRVLEGEAAKAVGDTVTEGELLVSARRGCALGGERLVHARAEVIARTWYEKTAVVPLRCMLCTERERERTDWGLQIGKSAVFFARDSSISDTRCDTIYSVCSLRRKSTFALPVAVLKRTTCTVGEKPGLPDETGARLLAEERLRAWLSREIGEEGSVTSLRFSSERAGDVLCVTLRAECTEPIAVERRRE